VHRSHQRLRFKKRIAFDSLGAGRGGTDGNTVIWPEASFRLQPYAARCKRYLCSATIFFIFVLKLEEGFLEKIYSCCPNPPRTLAERRHVVLLEQRCKAL
jgi:hypothetical protein